MFGETVRRAGVLSDGRPARASNHLAAGAGTPLAMNSSLVRVPSWLVSMASKRRWALARLGRFCLNCSRVTLPVLSESMASQRPARSLLGALLAAAAARLALL